MSINEKVVLITGASGGIGQGVARAFASEGNKLVLTDINFNNLINLKEKLENEYNSKILILAADGTKEEDVNTVIERSIHTFGRLDTVINIAQASKSGTY